MEWFFHTEFSEVWKQKKREERQNRKEAFWGRTYEKIIRIPFLKDYVDKVEKTYESICPYTEESLVQIASETLLKTFIASCISISIILLFNLCLEQKVSLYSIACAALAIHICEVEVLNFRFQRKRKEIVEEMVQYLEAVKHTYLYYKNIPRAVSEAAKGMSYEVKLHALQIYDILTGVDRKEKVRKYTLSPNGNKYMKLFLVQAYEASERGDMSDGNSSSLFAKNMEFLRLEMMQDNYNRSKREFKLQGYAFIALSLVFCMMPLKKWGTDFTPELRLFYESTGNFIIVISFLVTIFSYNLINKAKEINLTKNNFGNQYAEKFATGKLKSTMEHVVMQSGTFGKRWKEKLQETGEMISLEAFFLKMFLNGLCILILVLFVISTLHTQTRTMLLTDCNNLDTVVSVASKKQKETIQTQLLHFTREYKDTVISEQQLLIKLEEVIPLSNKESLRQIAKEILRRIRQYQNAYLKWYEILFAMCLGSMAGCMPLLELHYRARLLQTGREDEIRQFQAIILMERLFPATTIVGLLEQMETFAVIFKSHIRECVNNCAGGTKRALLQLKEQESAYPQFTELVDGFLCADNAGIEKAFDEVANNREMFEKIRELENEIALEETRDWTELIAYLPVVLIFGTYFILPFVIHSLGSVSEIFEIMESFQM